MTNPTSRKVDILARCTPLHGLSAEARQRLAAEGALIPVERREPLFSRGDPPEALFLVATGRVRVIRNGEREITMAYRGPGELVGETGWASEVHEDTAVALDRVETLRLPRRSLETVMAEEPPVARALLAWMTERAVALERRLVALLTRPVESRVAEFLLRARERHGIPDSRGTLIGVKFTHQEMASYVGSTRETVTLVLGELKRRGLITIDHRRVVVRDMEALSALAG